MSQRANNEEGGLLPLLILLGLLCLFLAYGIHKGFLSHAKPPSDKRVRLVIVAPIKPQGPYRDAIARFKHAHPDIGVDIQPVNGPRYYQKLLVMLASGNPPDLMWMGQEFAEFASRGAFLDVTRQVKRDVDTNAIMPIALRSYNVGGRQYGVPFLMDAQFIVYNKDIFDQAGLPYPKNDWDYDQFLRTAEQLTVRREGKVVRYGFHGFLTRFLFGAQFISDDGSRAACDTPRMIQYLETNNDLFHRYRVAPVVQRRVTLDKYGLFSSGRAAMMQAYTWDLNPLRRQCQSIRWGFVLNPKVVKRAEWASTQAVLISAKTKYPDAAWQLCKEFLSPKFQKSMAAIGMPTNLEIAKALAATGEPRYNHLPTLLAAVGEFHVQPRVAHLSEAEHLFGNVQEAVWNGRLSAEQAVKRAAREINRMIEQEQRYGS